MINSLVHDIEQKLDQGELDGEYEVFGRGMGSVLERGLQPRDHNRPSRVWFSNVGGPCTRKLWYKINTPADAEPLRPHTRLKFLYGDIIEELVLDLARRAGHLVEHEQRHVEWNGVSGRIDATIDGMLIDVKSTSSYSFKKFQGGLQREDDAFGYLGQLAGYLLVAREDGFVEGENRNRAGFLVVNKETGKIHLDVHTFDDETLEGWSRNIEENKARAETKEVTPDRAFEPTSDGKSGNLKLGVNCSYCDFKASCWPGLRTFLYSNKPVFLTHVERLPNVLELTNEG
jgi:hypothetical protein